jgi:polyketide synthase PksJ
MMDEIREEIAAIWREVLQLEEVDIKDNFFDIGGTSVLLTHVHPRLSAILGREIPLMDLFRYPTIESLVSKFAPEMDKANNNPVPNGS